MRWAMLLGFVVACGSSGSDEVIPDSGPCVADLTPPGGQCPAECTSCVDNVCHIECAAGKCNDRTVKCPANFACDIVCTGLDSCDTSKIECPADYACSVSCSAYDACGDVQLECGKGSCSMTCNGPSESCGGSLIDCAAGGNCSATCVGGASGPSVDCRGACGCTPC